MILNIDIFFSNQHDLGYHQKLFTQQVIRNGVSKQGIEVVERENGWNEASHQTQQEGRVGDKKQKSTDL